MGEWLIYRGVSEPHDGIDELPDPPPWRDFAHDGRLTPFDRTADDGGADRRLPGADAYRADEGTVEAVNTALYLRRPLLVTGDPGVGKSTLAHAVARELKLGQVLRWPVNSKTELRDGLYRYDSLGRLEEAGVARELGTGGGQGAADLGRYVRLGPLGTALAPYALPRVLLIDEIDKCDIDLPNDLLDVFEEGSFEIPELSRVADTQPEVRVRPADDGEAVSVVRGTVRCHAFPFTILTSNGEREFPPAFLRRCVRLHLPAVDDDERLRAIVRAHLPGADGHADAVIARFLRRAASGELATDQLLNAVYLMSRTSGAGAPDLDRLSELVFHHLNVTVPAES
ncbi:MoxR family ATPase [Streptomyces solicathayae]|uniref:MoxR family ATPase n=1 Tax=Streptomyces solicathayae TaxID=3081768 RepID=A0ABZ0LLS7_9ACTN|nr:MoxR family ATPase [Streptomyces sp. HUAS YS2]WOX20441.1 MoxR family ATPase [Streptomyces sp. HUAS YS2]